jgi:hypothetical protein
VAYVMVVAYPDSFLSIFVSVLPPLGSRGPYLFT